MKPFNYVQIKLFVLDSNTSLMKSKHWSGGESGECLPVSWEMGVQSRGELYKRLKRLYLMPPCLTYNIIRYVSKVKWSNPEKGVAPSSTPRCSSYWKGNLWVTLDYGCQLLLYMYAHNIFPLGANYSYWIGILDIM